MPSYLYQASYTGDAWATQINNPVNRAEQIAEMVKGAGGNVESFHYAFGEYDVIIIATFADNQTAAAFALAAAAGGAVKSLKTTPLLTADEGLEAIKKAGGTGYRPPGG